MSSSSAKPSGRIQVRSKFGPIRIELLDERLNRLAVGFGSLDAEVPAGLYSLHYGAGIVQDEDIVRVAADATVTREVDLTFPTVAPLSVSSTAHAVQIVHAVRSSTQVRHAHGNGGALMIFVRSVDGDGNADVPLDELSLWDATMTQVGDLNADAERGHGQGWACFSTHLDPGGYALRWQTQDCRVVAQSADSQGSIDQSLWVSAGWLTMVFIGYSAERRQLSRQSASIHMARLGEGFNPGPEQSKIRSNSVAEGDLRVARINQAVDLVLGGLRTGNQVVPDDLIDLLLHGKFQNPMLGIVGAHALIQRRSRDWPLFDRVVEQLEKVIPGHPDVAALRICGKLLRGVVDPALETESLAWPPMVCTGYRAVLDSDWDHAGKLIVDDSVAERAAAMLLPESPWSCWVSLEPSAVVQRGVAAGTPRTLVEKGFELLLTRSFGPGLDRVLQRVVGIPGLRSRQDIETLARKLDVSEVALRRISRYIKRLNDAGEDVDLSKLTIADFRWLGLPIATVRKGVERLLASREEEPRTSPRGTLTGRGALAQGPGAIAVGAGGVHIGGSSTGDINTGTQTRIDTGGGAYVGGNVRVTGGDFVGRDKISHGSSPEELAALCDALLKAVRDQPVPAAVQAQAVAKVAELKEEVHKGAAADDSKLAGIVDGLAGMVPGAVGAVVRMFAAPILQGLIGPVTRYVLGKLK